jgi:exonuclease III
MEQSKDKTEKKVKEERKEKERRNSETKMDKQKTSEDPQAETVLKGGTAETALKREMQKITLASDVDSDKGGQDKKEAGGSTGATPKTSTDNVPQTESNEKQVEKTDEVKKEKIIRISAINVHTLNIAAFEKGKTEKMKKKIKAITENDSDVILMSECKVGGIFMNINQRRVDKLKNIFKDYNYTLHTHSTKQKRGVAIAIRDNQWFKVKDEVYRDQDENCLLIKCEINDQIKTKSNIEEILVGVVYGPAEKKLFEDLREKIKDKENKCLPTILGGDFNTVLGLNQNLDLENRNSNIPNHKNGEILREWINEEHFCDPYREKNPSGTAMSYFGFRTKKNGKPHNYGASRLDFFIISESLFPRVEEVQYGEKPNKGFDHAEVILSLRKGGPEPLDIKEGGSDGGSGHSENNESELSVPFDKLQIKDE